MHVLLRSRWQRLRLDERGSAAAELTLFTPVAVMLVLFVVFCGRLAASEMRVTDAAHQAARSASISRTPGQADQNARTTAATALAQAGVTCQNLTVATDTQGLRPGAAVTVTVSCTVGLSDLGLLGVPGNRTVTATYTSTIDTYRGT
ncbi:TadE/TadG family type IV pilus assembly protein [Actinokineospora inagensis]|uniref:TadE/TadG family type IV pilus assembly protein n=1 Tax=Actinokineospora inagensis TaxID=103730 RepID=UPI0004220451|nr:TadE/TadG family type IV pilus assembly protein [Actinokineospora inagensis]